MWLSKTSLLLLAILCQHVYLSSGNSVRQKRFAAQSCMMTPDNTMDDVIEQGNSVNLQCTFDDEIDSCVWVHNEPMNENTNQDTYDIKCRGSADQSGETCYDEPRIQYTFSSTSCGISISSTEPEDTGKWILNGIGMNSVGGVESTKKEFELFTYNVSETYMWDEDNNDVSSIDTTYNYDERNKKFIEGKTGYESVILKCGAQGGRPEPEFIWYIENDENDGLEDSDDIDVSVSNRPVGQDDPNGYIKNWESEIELRIDDRFMEKLEVSGVESNPKDGVVRFQLTCEVSQGNFNLGSNYRRVDIRIERKYDNGALAANMIGIIVGSIFAIAIIIIVIVLLLFAKSRKIWCFSESDAEYEDRKRRPRNPEDDYRRDGRDGGNRRQRQHQRSPRR